MAVGCCCCWEDSAFGISLGTLSVYKERGNKNMSSSEHLLHVLSWERRVLQSQGWTLGINRDGSVQGGSFVLLS